MINRKGCATKRPRPVLTQCCSICLQEIGNTMKQSHSDNGTTGRNSDPGPPEYEEALLTTLSWRSTILYQLQCFIVWEQALTGRNTELLHMTLLIWAVTSCELAGRYQSFGGTNGLHLRIMYMIMYTIFCMSPRRIQNWKLQRMNVESLCIPAGTVPFHFCYFERRTRSECVSKQRIVENICP
jgi:hypothetical protein